MWKKWVPWRFLIKKAAQNQGFLDPIVLLSKIQRFAQPSEVAAPVELLRLATLLQARGFMNVQAIQHNLDWIWPYWVVRQFDPKDIAFIPRAFSLTHINLTHRNWTAAGIPDRTEYPLVDPRGLLTPFYDGWSLDAWIIQKDQDLLPPRAQRVSQKWELEENPSIHTRVTEKQADLFCRVSMELFNKEPRCILKIEASAAQEARLVVSLRPFNPEGVSEVKHVSILQEGRAWKINTHQHVYFSEIPAGQYLSNYEQGDIYQKIKSGQSGLNLPSLEIECKAGMVTAAAVFSISKGNRRNVEIQIPLIQKSEPEKNGFIRETSPEAGAAWKEALAGHCELQIHDRQAQSLYDTALRTLVLHTPGIDVFPGPYTYRHFWFRDACFILQALLAANLPHRAEKILDHFPQRQTLTGYFRSQDGEWDSNGQVLWIFRRFCEWTGTRPKESWKNAIHKGVQWIRHKRLSENLAEPHAGLFPAGFSAEHLGPNDYYYWDDFWGVEGLLSAASLMELSENGEEAGTCRAEARRFLACIEASLEKSSKRLNTLAMPASPYRRLDTGSIGSLAAAYPLNFWAPGDARVMETVEYLLKNHFVNGGFFHEMSHSGINPYLTLTVAQILLRNQDARYAGILHSLQALASPTGQWPEAIHPQTLGGCMGDGQHVWASAEWVLMVRNCFVREEGEKLVFCSGILPEWLEGAGEIFFGPTLTPYGNVKVRLRNEGGQRIASWEAEWRNEAPEIEIQLPGYAPRTVPRGECSAVLSERQAV